MFGTAESFRSPVKVWKLPPFGTRGVPDGGCWYVETPNAVQVASAAQVATASATQADGKGAQPDVKFRM
jgi:hypothetical protein